MNYLIEYIKNDKRKDCNQKAKEKKEGELKLMKKFYFREHSQPNNYTKTILAEPKNYASYPQSHVTEYSVKTRTFV